MREVVLNVEGLCCGHCCSRVEDALNEIEGVEARVDQEKEQALVKLEDGIENQVLIEALDEEGFDVSSVE